jgi:hypothetical protein
MNTLGEIRADEKLKFWLSWSLYEANGCFGKSWSRKDMAVLLLESAT